MSFRAHPLAFPILHRTFPFYSSDFPDFASDFPVFLRHIVSDHRAVVARPSGGGHVAIGRWSRGHRAVVAGNVLGKIEYRADGFHRHRE